MIDGKRRTNLSNWLLEHNFTPFLAFGTGAGAFVSPLAEGQKTNREVKKMVKEVKRDFRVLREIISPERVQVMAELITIK